MPQMEQTEFKFPDEAEEKGAEAKEAKAQPDVEIEIEDDTPAEDRGKTPMPKTIVETLEKDELEQYDDSVKEKLRQMRKVWHDERREKEAALREHQEAVALAQRVLQENQRIKEIYTVGEKEYVSTFKNAAELELQMAKKAYKEAYDAGDTDKIVEAQQAMQNANMKLMQVHNFRSPLQAENFVVEQPQQYQQPQQAAPRPDRKAEAWQERNPWFGPKKAMTAYALGIHEELRENGVPVGSDEYYRALDAVMRETFPREFQGEEQRSEASRPKPSTVVAPATRSTAPQKVRLKTSQLTLIKKLGITPEQYVKEYMKEQRNG